MKQRCKGTAPQLKKDYLDRNIKMCPEWYDFLKFFNDMGEKPDNTELDRIDNNQGYFKENCRWVSREVNSNNRRSNRLMTAFGETKTMKMWSLDSRCVVSYQTLNNRTCYGWTDERAITEPLNDVKNQWNT